MDQPGDSDAFLFLLRSICNTLGIEAPVVTDAFGRTDLAIDRAGMEKIRDAARAAGGYDDLADGIDQLLGAGPSMRKVGGKIVPITEGGRP